MVMVEARIIPGIQRLIAAETGVKTRVAVERLDALQQEAGDTRSGMVINARSAVLPELPEALQRRVADGAIIIIDCTGGLIVHPNGKNSEKK